MILHRSDRCRPHQKTVFVVMPARTIEVRLKADLRGLSMSSKVLTIQIQHEDLLIAGIEFV